MGISAEVLKDTLDASEGRFAIDDPLLVVELSPEGFEGSGLLEMADAAGENEIALCEAFFEKVKELTSEECRHDPYGNEETFAAWHPSASVRGQPAAGDNAVDVGMIRECLGCGAEKQIVHALTVH